MKILFLSSEVAPFARTGGLGDVSASLPKALKYLDNEVRVVTPCYRTIKDRKYGLRDVTRLKELSMEMDGKSLVYSVKSGFIPGSKVQTYFLHYPEYFDRRTLYVDPRTGKDYSDNYLRYGFMNHATLQLMLNLQWIPDIIHCNDWQSGLVPYLLRHNDRYIAAFAETRSVMHLHNVGYQGLFPTNVAGSIEINPEDIKPGALAEFYEKISFLKLGVACADGLVTVSPTYAREIQSNKALGSGLEGLFEYRSRDLYGILNGVDADVWDPSTDSAITQTYNFETVLEGKAANKEALQKRLKLNVDPEIPLVAMIARLVDQKGLDLLAAQESELLKLPVQFAFLGVGLKDYEQLLTRWAKDNPHRVAAVIRFNDDIAHLLEAGADIYLMPSRYEPCGLNQMYSLLYGTVPVVRKTGGLADTVIPYDKANSDGTGFVFDEYDGKAMVSALKLAIQVYHQKDKWRELQLKGMQEDFSWSRSAVEFEKLYNMLIDKPVYS